MSIEYTGANNETVSGEVKNFLESCPPDTQFKMVINFKRGYFKVRIINIEQGRIRKLFGRLRRRKVKT
ncbi:MAG: hypothetical protein OIN89_04980 [Candidatus Methanoperedens sp.]|jgi:hypothetical protein|nr:hypothetical protein [Candidatus Methanoperedens sp.]PKL52795.1 MAG: hypothetical protein CVV36_10555 [Candidatus Methanoperedenaceae archaeon HGW-Methanoperedenaceae-1]